MFDVETGAYIGGRWHSKDGEMAKKAPKRESAALTLDDLSLSTEELMLKVARAELARRLRGESAGARESALAIAEREYEGKRAVCTHCDREKLIVPDFGFRNARGKLAPQSWCRACRNSPDSHPTRFGLR